MAWWCGCARATTTMGTNANVYTELITLISRYPNMIISFSTTTATPTTANNSQQKLSKRIIDKIQVLTNCCLNTKFISGDRVSEKKIVWKKSKQANYNTRESKNSYLYMTYSTTHIGDLLLRVNATHIFNFSIGAQTYNSFFSTFLLLLLLHINKSFEPSLGSYKRNVKTETNKITL